MITQKDLTNPSQEPKKPPKCGNAVCHMSQAIWKFSILKGEWFIMCYTCRKVHWIPKHQRITEIQ